VGLGEEAQEVAQIVLQPAGFALVGRLDDLAFDGLEGRLGAVAAVEGSGLLNL
jgi:hypothetical protein